MTCAKTSRMSDFKIDRWRNICHFLVPSCKPEVYKVRVDREDEVQEKKTKKESFPRDSKSRSKSKLGEGVEKQMLIVGETNF